MSEKFSRRQWLRAWLASLFGLCAAKALPAQPAPEVPPPASRVLEVVNLFGDPVQTTTTFYDESGNFISSTTTGSVTGPSKNQGPPDDRGGTPRDERKAD